MSAGKATQSVDGARTLIGHQPARVILLDTSYPFERQAGKSMCHVLENIFCVSSNMAGPPRIPLIGIYMLTTFPEVILPLTYTKSNFVRLHSAVADIQTYLEESLQHDQAKEVEQCIPQGVMEACKQYRRYVANLPKAPSNFNQLELIILTGHPGHFVQNKLSDLPEKLDLNIIKRVVSATLTSSLMTSQPMDSPEVPVFDAISDDFTGLVDVVTLECDQMSLQRFFYGWLMDSSSETEHIHLVLPPPTPADTQVVIKCDLSERMLSPTQLPFHDCYNLHIDSSICKHIYPTPSKAIGMTVAVQHLEAVSCLPRECLCESVLYGTPLLATPTACWKIDWEMLEKNQHYFVSLCIELLKRDQVLLTRLLRKSQGPPTNNSGSTNTGWSNCRTNSTTWPPKPTGFFVLMPCEQRYFLLKSVLSSEFLLPSTQTISPGNGSEESDLCIQASLTQVKTMNTFNPLNLSSGLFAALKHSSLPKSAVDKARTYKRKAVALKDKSNNWGCPSLPSPTTRTPVPGSRLTANHWSNPLADYKKNATTTSSLSRNQKSKR